MKGKMSMEWNEIFTDDPCPECNGDRMASVAVLDMNNDVHVPYCSKCEGFGKKIDPKKYDIYMDEYNYRHGLD